MIGLAGTKEETARLRGVWRAAHLMGARRKREEGEARREIALPRHTSGATLLPTKPCVLLSQSVTFSKLRL